MKYSALKLFLTWSIFNKRINVQYLMIIWRFRYRVFCHKSVNKLIFSPMFRSSDGNESVLGNSFQTEQEISESEIFFCLLYLSSLWKWSARNCLYLRYPSFRIWGLYLATVMAADTVSETIPPFLQTSRILQSLDFPSRITCNFALKAELNSPY